MTRSVQQLFDLTGKTALVTGGSRGLGLQMAQALGEAGARVLLTSRKAADLEQAAAQLQAQGIDAQWVAADCANEADIQRLVQEATQRLGGIDILVNNAGASWGAPAEDHPVAAWDKVMNLNIRGYFLLSQAVAKAGMLHKGGAHYQSGFDCRAGRQSDRDEDDCLQHVQRRGAEFHPRAGGGMGAAQHHGECDLPRFFPHQDGRGAD